MIKYETTLKARTFECDMYGHVNNASFLNYCEAARVDFLNHLGFSLKSLIKNGWLLPIVKIEINYKLPVFADDELLVSVIWKSRRQTSAVFEQEVIKKSNGQLAARAEITWVSTDLKNTPIPIPLEMLDCISKEFGELPEVQHPAHL